MQQECSLLILRQKITTRKWLQKFDELVEPYGFQWKLRDIMPEVLVAGQDAGTLTEEGAKFLDPSGRLKAGIPMCPPEGDAGTGMVATNSVKQRTGNVSAGTSVFAMIVLEKALSKPYTEIDMVTTPAGDAVAMAHCNNCTSDLNAWVNVFKEFAEAMGMEVDMNKLFGTLYNKALEGDPDCGGLLSYCYFSGEHMTGFEEGRPLFVRSPESKFTLGKLYEDQSLHLPWSNARGLRHPDRPGACQDRQTLRTRRTVQDQRRRTADPCGRSECTGICYVNRR